VKKRAFAVLTVIAVLALLVGGCATPAPPAPEPTTPPPPPEATKAPEATTPPEPVIGTTYKLGFFASITGPTSSLGVPERNTAEMIAAQIEEAGGVTGPDGVIHPVEFVIYDDESTPDVAATVASRLIEEDEVDAIVGGTGSGPSLAVVPLIQEAEVPWVSMASSRSIIKNPETGETYKWCFKTPQENLHSGGWQAVYAEAMGWDQVCDIYSNDGYGQDCLANTIAAMEEKGIEVSYSDSFEPTDTEFPQIASVVASGCDALIIGAVPPGAALVTVAAREGAPDLPVVLGHGVCNATMIDAAGAAAEGTVFPCGKLIFADLLPDDDPQKALLLKYIADYTDFTGGEPISTFGGHAYDGLWWVLGAMASLEDGLDLNARRVAIRDYLETEIKDWPGTGGVFNVTADDHLGLTYEALGFVKIEDGTWAYYPPEEWETP
jgi:branched-chain amino acid transport system substrate-binding protein